MNLAIAPEMTEIPPITGSETAIAAATQDLGPVVASNLDVNALTSGFACALHMHQPTIPAGAQGALISNLQHMFEHPHDGDNHNAGAFLDCYGRMGHIVPDLVAQGLNPRIMLDYSGNLLWGLQQMGQTETLQKLRRLAADYPLNVEWLGTMWSHAVASSTPIADFKLQIRAWQYQFAALFGLEALGRVKGFSPPEMHLPNHPDTLYAYLVALQECGYRWLMVQEHTVETLEGHSLPQDQKYIPNRLVARNSQGQTVEMLALIKTQGSDTKLVAQMQPYYEAKSRGRVPLTTPSGDQSLPACVTQIADGENGGVMMNEFPRDYPRPWGEIAQNPSVAGLNGTEYLELLEQAGIARQDYPACQAVHQHKIWQRCPQPSPDSVQAAIAELSATDSQFSMDGGSWTNHLSWVRGYENVLEPMYELSARFHQRYDEVPGPELEHNAQYQQALLYNLLLQTSCFRYWGQGSWTDYARELYRRGAALV
jgi:hypothetical protein